MVGFPKTIKTGQDLYNCLAMVKNGDLPAVELKQEIERIERTNSLYVPVNGIDGRKATVSYCNEVSIGMTLQNSLKVTAIDVVKGDDDQPKETIITFGKNVPTDTTELIIPLAASIFNEMGISQERLDEIKGELVKYE